MCLPHGDRFPRHYLRTLLQAHAALSTIATRPFPFAGACPTLDLAANCRSNPIAHRVRRKRQRLPPSLLIENASVRHPAPPQKSASRRFRSRLATNRKLLRARSPLPGSWKLRWHWAPTAGESRSTRELRCGEHAWAGAADTRSRRIFIAENHSSTALVGCSWTFDSALAGAATVDGVAQHWLSWMLERSAHLVAGNPD